MQLAKKTWKILALVMALCFITTSIVAAVVYMTKTINTTVTVTTTGSIELYSDAGFTTVLSSTSFSFGSTPEAKTLDIWVKNTGNVQVVLRWLVTGASWTWYDAGPRYWKGGTSYSDCDWSCWMAEQAAPTTYLKSKDSTTPWTKTIAMGGSEPLRFRLLMERTVAATTFSFSIDIEAADA